MSDSMSLARRAVACRGWRWMPGMRAVRAVDDLEPKRLLHGTEGPLLVWPAGFEERDGTACLRVEWPGAYLPDLSDPATRGCLEAMAGAAHTDPLLRVEGYPDGWRVYSPAKSRIVGLGPDRAAAIVAALEAAP